MKIARFWMGLAIMIGLAAAIGHAFVPEPEATRYGLVQGTVTYRGRPVRGGLIFFLEEGRHFSEAVIATIEPGGHYECPETWLGDRSTRRPYRIYVHLLEADESPPLPRTVGAAGGDGSRGDPDAARRPGDDPRLVAGVVTASVRWSGPVDANRLLERPRRHRFSDVATTDLVVWLDAQPAHVDIALND